MTYEYKVVPAPVRGLKAKGVKTPESRFAHALETAMNDLAKEGWEYVRADTLPCEQRDGLMSKTTVYQNMLVFRRSKDVTAPVSAPIEPPLTKPEPKDDPAEDVAADSEVIEGAPSTDTEAGAEPKKSTDVAAE